MFNKQRRLRQKLFHKHVKLEENTFLALDKITKRGKRDIGQFLCPFWQYYELDNVGFANYVHLVELRHTKEDPLMLEYVVFKSFNALEPLKHSDKGHIWSMEIARFGRDFEAAENYAIKLAKLEKNDWNGYCQEIGLQLGQKQPSFSG